MAIVPVTSSPEVTAPPAAAPSTVEITERMQNVSITPPAPPRSAAAPTARFSVPIEATARPTSSVYTDRKLLRRDSIERREAFLRGKEGSRQRRRWENGNCTQLRSRTAPELIMTLQLVFSRILGSSHPFRPILRCIQPTLDALSHTTWRRCGTRPSFSVP